jgi:putative capsular polysaccharide synthesis protein
MQDWADGQPLDYKMIQLGFILNQTILKKKLPIKIISMTREPINRNLSAFFQNYYRFTGQRYQGSALIVAEMIKIFLSLEDFQQAPLIWYDSIFKTSLGVDIYAYEFPKEQGYMRIQQDNYDILLYKSEIERDLQEQIIGEFLGNPDFKLLNANVSKNKHYADDYKQMKEKIFFTEDYVDMMLNSKFVRHFYTDEERTAFREKWLRHE